MSKTWAEWKDEYAKLEAQQERTAYEAEMRRDEAIEKASQAPRVEATSHLASADTIVSFQPEGDKVHVAWRRAFKSSHRFQEMTREAARRLWRDLVAKGFRRW